VAACRVLCVSWCCGSMSCVMCESYVVQMSLAVDVLLVPHSVRL